MNKIKIIAGLLVLMLFLLTACSADPRKEASAYATRVEAEQKAQSEEQALEQKTRLDGIAVKDAERTQAIKDAAMANAKVVYGWMVLWGGITLTIVLVYVIISVGHGLNVVIQGTGAAVARAAMVKANLIYLDQTTGQYPVLLEYVGNGKYSLSDVNTRTTMLLDTRNDPDKLMVQGAMAIRHVGVLSAAASRSKDPTGVSMIQPLLIEQDMEAS